MRMGIITQRRKQRRAARLKKGLIRLAAACAVFGAVTLSPSIRSEIEGAAKEIQTFSQAAQLELTLSEYPICALQLAVFDSGERAASELKRLQGQGVRCVIWQKERMRIVADTAFERDQLNFSAAKGHEAYVISDTLEAVSLRLSADAVSVELAKRLLEAPDTLLHMIVHKSKTMEEIAAEAQAIGDGALACNQENALYTQLAQNLLGWSTLITKTLEETDEAEARSYGAVTMCLLCKELRQALSALSTASAQRTPSTAADVMPPA